MSDKSNQLVIFLAFANDRENTLRYLRNLPDEARRLREVLEAAEKADLCEVVVRTNCTAEDIFKVFQDPQYRNRIAIFHYGGHANGYQLLLESADGQAVAANAGGFSAFLAQQKGMQLVFLNGCSTREQTQGLLNAKISAVISTSRSIDDKVATDFAYHFYQGLAGGASIHTAYNEAAASIQTSKGDDTRDIYVEGPDGTQDQPETDRWPWDLHLCEGGESAGQWNLPQAVDDPLFGLPPLSQQDLPESPYRYLNWFTSKDAEVFFGRGHQIREIYDRLTAPHSAPILLFYGQSGVGKSSLLDAGLIPRLEMDYEVRYLRRSGRGLLATLQSVFAADVTKSGLDSAWRDQEEKSGRPLIVFLDQVEEIFTRPAEHTPDEMEQFLQALKVIFDDPNRRPKGRLVLGFRKEWLAELETHLASHELPRSKVFLQPLDRRGVIEVVRGPTVSKRLRDRYGLSVGDDLPEIIADDLIEDRDSAIAPTLQILLTKLWTEAREENYEQPEFTQELYQKLKRDGILLRDFLDQQIAVFRKKHPEVVDSGLLLDIISLHTTALGTAGHCSLEEIQQQYEHIGDALPELLQQCQDLHLLTVATSTGKDSDKSTRLAHDTLAPLVREQYDESDKPGQRARRILDNRSKDWQDENKGTPLDEADLEVVKAGLTGTSTLNEAEKRLVGASEEQHRKQLQQRRNRKLATVFAVVVIALAGAFGWFQFIKAGKATTEAKVAATEAQANLALLSWGKGVESRDRDNRPTEAAYWFAGAATSGDAGISSSARLAVTDAVRNSSLSQILEHEGRVTGAVFNDDETRILSWSQDKTIRMWDVATGKAVIPPLRHDDKWLGEYGALSAGVRGAVFNDDESRILSWSEDKSARLWDTVTGNEVITPLQHRNWVTGAVFNDDETRILSWSDDYTVRLWDVATGIEAIPQMKHVRGVTGAVFNDDETRILSWSADKTVRLWDVVTSSEVITPLQHEGVVNGAVFNDNETRILSWSGDTVRLWDTVTGNEVIMPLQHGSYVTGAVFNDDETRILSWSRDETVRLWDVATGSEVIPQMTHEGWVRGAVFNDDETRILSWSDDYTVRLWDTVTGNEVITPLEHGDRVLGAVFNDNETRILSWSGDKTVRLWDAATGTEVITPLQHGSYVTGAVFNDDETRILSWSADKTVRLWDVVTGSEVITQMKHKGRVLGAVFNDDERRILSWSDDRTIRLLDTTTGNEVIKQLQHGSLVTGAVFNDDETRILSWSHDETVRLWDVATGTELITPLHHGDGVVGAAFNDDETRILSWSMDRTIRLWDTVTGNEVITQMKHDRWVIGAVFNDDETRILSWSDDHTVRLWDTVTGNEVIPQMKHDSVVKGAVFNDDETRILSWSDDRTVRLWDTVTGTEVITPLQHENRVSGAVFNDDETRILSWSGDKTVRLWDTVTGTEVIPQLKHENWVHGAMFNVDETRILSRDDKTVRLWDVATGNEVIPQMKHEAGVLGAVFNGDETRILSWGGDKTVRLWNTVTGNEVITPLQYEGDVLGAVFNDDETRILSWGAHGVDQDDISYDAHISPEKLILQIQARTGTYLTPSGQLKVHSAADWHRIKLEYEDQ